MNTTEHDSLDMLMARLADGDRSVFSTVFKLLWSPILRLSSSLLENEADASDAAQQAMEKILARASNYDPSRPALPWALAIAAWECRTIRRKLVRRREVPEEAVAEPTDQDSEETLVRRNLTQAAVTALGELSDTDRETLLATYWDEAATSRGATFRKRRERALSRLRDAFRRIYGLD